MEIKNFKKLRGNVYEIELDDFRKFKLYDDIILKYELLIEKRLTKKKLETIINENNLLDAYYQSLKYISIKMRSEVEVREYLRKKSFSVFEADYAVTRLRNDGYINEVLYVQAFINDALNLSLDGPKKISENLKRLGMNESLINEYLNKVDRKEWLNRIERVLQKKAKINKSSEKMFKNKITADLLNLGYFYEDIKNRVDDFHIDVSGAFLKEADKIYSKLAIKYSGTELVLRFKQKLFTKGYDADLINNYINEKS